MIRGIDASSIQGIIPWHILATQGISFAYLKCTEGNRMHADGTPIVDSCFAANVAAAKNVGIAVGAYSFAYPLPADPTKPGRSPKEQAQFAFDGAAGLGLHNGELPLAVDAEWPAPEDWARWKCSATQIRDWLLEHLEETERIWGRAPVLYTYPYWWSKVSEAGGMDAFAKYPLWAADYASFPHQVPPDGSSPRKLSPWPSWTLWQHSGGGLKLPSGAGVDGNVFNGDEVAWQLFLRVTPDQIVPADDQPVYVTPDPEQA